MDIHAAPVGNEEVGALAVHAAGDAESSPYEDLAAVLLDEARHLVDAVLPGVPFS